MNFISFALLAVVSVVGLATTRAQNYFCAQISTTPSFDFGWFTEKTWYIQQMKPSGRYHSNDRFCALMTFERSIALSGRNPRFITRTYAKSSMLSTVNESVNPLLCLTWPNNAQMTLGSCFYPTEITPWLHVVAMNKDAGWVVAVEGQPAVEMSGLCALAKICGQTNAKGIYIMSRDQVANSTDILAARVAAVAAGVCMDQVIEVQQSGCSYQGAVIRN